jgi:hypothetical protein
MWTKTALNTRTQEIKYSRIGEEGFWMLIKWKKIFSKILKIIGFFHPWAAYEKRH